MSLINITRLAQFWANVKQRLDMKASADLSNVNIANFAQKMNESVTETIYRAESTDGVVYTVNIPGVTELKHGMRIIISPSCNSNSVAPMINVNGLGEKGIRIPISANTVISTVASTEGYYAANKPVLLMYDADYLRGTWKAVERQRTSASDIYGAVPVDKGGTGATTTEEALEVLGAASSAYVEEKIAALEARLAALESK